MPRQRNNRLPDVEAQLKPAENSITLSGILIERKALRFTPAGVPVTECVIGHQSEQIEAGSPRCVECEIQAVGLGQTAKWLQAAVPGSAVSVTGFLAAKSRHSKQLRLHLTTIEFVEGN